MDKIQKDLEHALELIATLQDTMKSELTLGDVNFSLWKIYEDSDEAYYSIRLALEELKKFEPDVRTDIKELFSG